MRVKIFIVLCSLIVALSARGQQWAQSNVSALCLRSAASHGSEMETQAFCGMPLRVDSVAGDWARVSTPDGVDCYAPLKSIVLRDSAEMAAWRKSPRLIATSLRPELIVGDTLAPDGGAIVSDVTLCSIFEGEKSPGAVFAEVRLPDGRRGYIRSEAVEDFDEWSRREPSADRIIDAARSMMGTPYLWGGTTSKSTDCSGFTQLSFFYSGIMIPRNSRGQAAFCGAAEPDMTGLERGDLLFFGEGDGERITHVGIYSGVTRFLHSSGMVRENSFDPEDPWYIPRRVLCAGRVDLQDPSLKVANHPWYFER